MGSHASLQDPPAAAAAAQGESLAACPICLEPMADDVVALGCGHLFHERCLAGVALRHCALCRAPVRPDRIKSVSTLLIPGQAGLPPGSCTQNWVLRSQVPLPLPPPQAACHSSAHPQPSAAPVLPARAASGQPLLGGLPTPLLAQLAAWQGAARLQGRHPSRGGARSHLDPSQRQQQAQQAAQQQAVQQRRQRRSPEEHPARDIPASESAALLEGIMLQLGAAAGAAGGSGRGGCAAALLAGLHRVRAAERQHPQQQQPACTWSFCIDISSSMGSSRAWQPHAVSRLCFALATLACVVDIQVAAGDLVQVSGFDADLAVLKRWFRKPASFDKESFLAECTGAVRHSGLRRWGTRLCTAVQRVVTDQAQQAATLAASAATSAATTRPRHSLVLLTDGDADDGGTAFAAAAALMQAPPFAEGGFRALLMHIDHRPERNRDWLRRLARSAGGEPLPYVDVLELALPARLDLSLTHCAGSSALAAGRMLQQRNGRSSSSEGGGASASGTAAGLFGGRDRRAELQANRGGGGGGASGGGAGGGMPEGAQGLLSCPGGAQQAQQAAHLEDDAVRALSRAFHAFSTTIGSAPSMDSMPSTPMISTHVSQEG